MAPFDGDELRAFLGARAVPGIEEVDGDVYRRSLALPGGPAVAELDLGEGRAIARVRLTDPNDLPEAIRRITSLPASRVGIKDRGLLATGMHADLVVFDAQEIASRFTVQKPRQHPVGIVHVRDAVRATRRATGRRA